MTKIQVKILAFIADGKLYTRNNIAVGIEYPGEPHRIGPALRSLVDNGFIGRFIGNVPRYYLLDKGRQYVVNYTRGEARDICLTKARKSVNLKL